MPPKRYAVETKPLERPDDGWTDRARSILAQSGVTRGYALVCGLGTGRLAEALALDSDLHVIAVDPDAARIDRFRRRWDKAGLYGRRIAAMVGTLADIELPPYLANLIVSEDAAAAGFDADDALRTAFACLRPFNGELWLELPKGQYETLGRCLTSPNSLVPRSSGMTPGRD